MRVDLTISCDRLLSNLIMFIPPGDGKTLIECFIFYTFIYIHFVVALEFFGSKFVI